MQICRLLVTTPKHFTNCYIDATEGEYIPIRGGGWSHGESAGVFSLSLRNPRSGSWADCGGRSAFFKKKQKAER